MNKKVLILGAGYVGTKLHSFLKTNHHVNIISKKELDYSNPKTFSKFLSDNRYDWVINCSGFTGTPNVDGCEDHKEECFHYNVTVPLQITKICNYYNIAPIHIGSGCVYSGYNKIYTEDDLADFGMDSHESSFYSKTKDAFEKLSNHMDRYILRIRIPFNGIVEPKNYLYKLLNYDNLISKQNSITCVDDLLHFIYSFMQRQYRPEFGIYNVVNEGSVDGFDVIQMLKNNGLENPNWSFKSIEEMNFKVARSNCILSTDKIKQLGLGLPSVNLSLEKAIKNYSDQIIFQ
jgi:dTDP-4-dehydrorhamnose reductase